MKRHHKVIQKPAPKERLNHAADTVEWFLIGKKYRVFGAEHYRV